MAIGQGIKSKSAFLKEAGEQENYKIWGDGSGAASLGATHQIPLQSENISRAKTYQNDNSLDGKSGVAATYNILNTAEGTLNCTAHYENLDRLLCLFMGFENPAADADGGSPHVPEAGVYNHLYELDDIYQSDYWQLEDLAAVKIDGSFKLGDRKTKRGTLAFAKQVSDWRYVNSVINQLTISGNPSDNITMAFDIISYAYDSYRGSYNSGNWTLNNTEQIKTLFSDLTFKIGQVGGALTNYGISNFTITANKNLTNNDQDTSAGLKIIEPASGGFRDVTGSIELARYNSNTFMTIFDSTAYYYMEFDFLGNTIPGTSSTYELRIRFPKIKLTEAASNISGSEVLGQSLAFKAFRSDTTDFSYNVTLVKKNEMTIETINQFSSNILREN